MRRMNLLFHDPANKWEEALPIGNGSLGGMIYGRVDEETIQVNEDTLWSGKPLDDSDFDLTSKLAEARRLIDEGQYVDAHGFINKHMLGHWTQNYLPMCNIKLRHKYPGESSYYERSLDMLEGISYVSYRRDNVNYTREYFCSKVDNVMVIHVEADQSGALNCEAYTDSPLKFQVEAPWDYLIGEGEAPIHVDPIYDSKETPIIYKDNEKGISFGTLIKAESDGIVFTNNNRLDIQNATYVTLYFVAKTNFIDPFTTPDHDMNLREQCNRIMKKVLKKGYKAIKEDHIVDFSGLMERVSLTLSDEDDTRTTDQHIDDMENSEQLDGKLIEEIFQFGRYLIVSGSREGSQATNLQGIWNSMMQAPWCSNYTININTQMNYWPVDVANLSECYEPLTRLVEELAVSGVHAAKGLGCDGWTANHNTDLWRQSIPVSGNAQYAFWPFGGPWLTTLLYEHYLFTEDRDFLEQVYPVIKGSALFCMDWAYEDEKTGYMVTSPATSPENSFVNEEGGVSAVTKASAMDMNITWQVLTDCIHAMEILGIEDESLLKKLHTTRDKLYPLKITKDGLIGEWWDEQVNRDLGHRHVSHLCGLYPGHRIQCDEDDALMEAHYQSLEDRIANGGGHTSWSCAWVTLLYARLRNQGRTKDMMMKFFKHSLIRNGLSSHPPFQIDGNYGFTAAVCETLLQSHNDYIEILPALPEELVTGAFTGLRARGGYEISARWKEGRVIEVRVNPTKTSDIKLKVNGEILTIHCEMGEEVCMHL